jgi:serine/threonine-protein kinase
VVLSEGSEFAGYRIERVLGSGGMGTVYLGRGADLPRGEAIKVLSAELSRDPDFRARFVREADVAAGLDHPNVVSIYGRGEFEGQLWIAMQFVDGIDADDALQAGAMTPARAVHVVGEVAKALDYAHAHQVVHRDVKPANFLLSGALGLEERVLLGDFGIARALDDAKLTATGSFVATVAYAAPEVLAGGFFDGRADLYSLGCTLFRLLSGTPPYASTNGMAAVMAAHLTAPPPRLSDRVTGLSPRMDAVLATAMAKDPAQRFGSAREFAAAVGEALSERTTVALRPVPGSAVAPYVSPPPVAAFPPPGPFQHPGPPVFPPPRRRRGRWIAVAAALVVAALVAVGVTLAVGSKHGAAPAAGPTSTPASATSATPKVTASTLLRLLLTPEQGAEIMGAPSMKETQSLGSISDDASWRIVEKDCVGAWVPAQRIVYAATGWTAAKEQTLSGPMGSPMAITQTVIAYASADAARKVVEDQVPQWSACSGRTVTLVPQENFKTAVHLTFGPLVNTDGIVSMVQSSPDMSTNNLGSQRALAARGNVVIDVAISRPDVTNEAVDVLNAIAAKIPH